MMRYRLTAHYKAIEDALRQSLTRYGLTARLAKDRAFQMTFGKTLNLYMKYSKFGIAVFEEIDEREFNPNISLELGYMYALGRRCLLLKDKRMPRLPTDTCGKIYRDFDTYDLPTSIINAVCDWCERDLCLPLVSSDGASDSIGEDHAMEVYAKESESVGINKSLATVAGKAIFGYRAMFSSASVVNLYCCMIPMQKYEPGRQFVEVGATFCDDPGNPYSPHRKRYYVKHAHIGDGKWHKGEIEVDFHDIPGASYSVFVARVNEGCPRPGPGKIQIRNVQIIASDKSENEPSGEVLTSLPGIVLPSRRRCRQP